MDKSLSEILQDIHYNLVTIIDSDKESVETTNELIKIDNNVTDKLALLQVEK